MSDLHYYDPSWITPSTESLTADICIYGASAAGVMAAVEAARNGKKPLLLQPGKFIGGLTTGGLGWTDYGRKHVIGGLSREFYRRAGKHYGKDEEFQFEPNVAMKVLQDLLREHNIDVRLCQYLEAVQLQDKKIQSIKLQGGLTVSAKVFIDATYEGDLLAKAGVSYTVGREANSVYNENVNGIQIRSMHQFSHPVDPYVVEGKPNSGLLPFIESEDLSQKIGQGDKRVQAYNFRVCMTDDPALKIPWAKPENFNPQHYILVTRWLQGEKDKYNELLSPEGPHSQVPWKFDIFPNLTKGGFHKTDTNNHGAVSSDFIGQNWEWPEGCYECREKIFQAHVTYQRGFYWHVANSPDIPERYRNAVSAFGLPSDEFTATENWPHQLYVREARRMISDYVITEHTCRGEKVADDPVGMGSYGMDSHNCTRFLGTINGRPSVLNEGDLQVPAAAYRISYRSIVPKAAECPNLLVPVCLSSSHIAYGSARMEPVFMVLGQSAAVAASLAIDAATTVHGINPAKFQLALHDRQQVLSNPPS